MKKSTHTISTIILAGWLRSLIADYGVPLMVLVWTGISYIPSKSVPEGIPRRLFSPNPWSPGAYENWTVIKVRLISFLLNLCLVKSSSLIVLKYCIFGHNFAGYAWGSSYLHMWSFHPGYNDCSALLFRP